MVVSRRWLGSLLVSYLFLMPLATLAADSSEEHPNECHRLHLQIGNATAYPCQLVKSKVVHGRLYSFPPAMIFPGTFRTFDAHQTLRGPEITLTYQCHEQTVTFTSQQNYCFWKAGNITPTVNKASTNLTVTYHKENGSWRWEQPGVIYWMLTAK